MPKTISDSTGEDVEVYTKEELQIQKDAVLEEFKNANPDKTNELNKLQEDLKKANEDLDKAKNKDTNFANLREAKEALENKVKELNESIDSKVGSAKKEIMDGVVKEHYSDIINKLAGDDKELLAKIEFQYKRLGDAAGTKAEIEKKLNDAYVLATGNMAGGIGQRPFSSGGSAPLKIDRNNNPPLNSEEMDLAKKLAAAGGIKLEDKDLKNI